VPERHLISIACECSGILDDVLGKRGREEDDLDPFWKQAVAEY
jgi:hypothetical protein